MKRDADYFASLADLSELALLSVVRELASRRDLESLHGFMDFVQALPDLVNLPVLAGNESLTFSSPSHGQDENAVHGLSPAEMQTFAGSLGAASDHGDAYCSFSHRGTKEIDPFEDDQKRYLVRLLDMANSFDPESGWVRDVTLAIAANVNSDKAVDVLAVAGVSFETMSYWGSEGCVQKTLAGVALRCGNLVFAAEAFRHQSKSETQNTFDKIEHGLASHTFFIPKLQEGLAEHADQVHAILQALEEKLDGIHAALLRARLMDCHIMRLAESGGRIDTQTLETLIGTTALQRQDFKTLCASEHHVIKNLTNHSVSTHTADLLPFLESQLKPRFYEDGTRRRLPAGIGTALDEDSLLVNTPTGHDALRRTLQCLVTCGHDLSVMDNRCAPVTALHFLAKCGTAKDRVGKLHVLLELGADSLARDKNNKLAVDVLNAKEREAWNHVVHSFGARKLAYAVFDDMEEPAATTVGRSRTTNASATCVPARIQLFAV